jgi:hypothetical protein
MGQWVSRPTRRDMEGAVSVDVTPRERALPDESVAASAVSAQVVAAPEIVHASGVFAPPARNATVTLFPEPGAAVAWTARFDAVTALAGDSV